MLNISWNPEAQNLGMVMFHKWADLFPKADLRFFFIFLSC
jgi:hypothetical protein